MKTKFLKGKGFYLREIREDDLKGNCTIGLMILTLQNIKIKKFSQIHMKTKNIMNTLISSKDVVFAIIDDSSDLHIGNVGLHHIEWVHRSAELELFLKRISW